MKQALKYMFTNNNQTANIHQSGFRGLIIVILSLLSFTGCTNLDEVLFDKITMDDYGKTSSEVQTIVGGAYATLRGFNDTNTGGTLSYPTGEFVFFLNECTSDEACIPTRGTDWYDGGRYQQLQYHTWDANNATVLSAWKYNFQGVANINTIIYMVNKSSLTQDDKNVVNAELRGLRAYYYYNLLDLYGGVPIVTSFETTDVPKQASRDSVFRFVEKELIEITELLPSGIAYSRFTQNVAYTLLARLYLNAEVFTGTPRWKDCLTACEKVKGFTLNSNYFDNFATDNDQKAEEIIFAIPYDHKQNTQGNYLASMTYHYNQKYAFSIDGTYPWCGNGICAKPAVYGTFDAADTRRKSLLVGDQLSKATGEVIMMDNGSPLSYTVDIGDYTKALQNEGARLHKYQWRADDKWERDNDLVLMRYAEVIMMKAEANYRQGFTTTAANLVNQLRKRAGLGDISTLDNASLETEWLHEFIFEGLRRNTNIRFGTFFNSGWNKSVTPAYRGVFPIPQSVLDLNKNLIQNTGY